MDYNDSAIISKLHCDWKALVNNVKMSLQYMYVCVYCIYYTQYSITCMKFQSTMIIKIYQEEIICNLHEYKMFLDAWFCYD